jgi:hypothetical protein
MFIQLQHQHLGGGSGVKLKADLQCIITFHIFTHQVTLDNSITHFSNRELHI